MAKQYPLISIIVPVYNAEIFLRACIESILKQDYRNIEIVLIDDGSKDDSGLICDEYTMIDSRVRVIHQKNSGVSAARNKGIDCASGEFITFVDADDLIVKDAISVMMKYITLGVDIVRTNYISRKAGVEKKGAINVPVGLYDRDDISSLIEAVMLGGILAYTPLLMIRSSILKTHKLKFDMTLAMMEDTKFYVELLDKCNSVYVSDYVTYIYIINNVSASRDVSNYKRNIGDVIKVNSYFKQNFEHKIIGISKKIDATHVISMASQIASTVEYPNPAYAAAKLNIKWLKGNTSFNQLYENADLSDASLYSRLVLFLIKGGLVFPVLTLFSVRGFIRRFI